MCNHIMKKDDACKLTEFGTYDIVLNMNQYVSSVCAHRIKENRRIQAEDGYHGKICGFKDAGKGGAGKEETGKSEKGTE